MARVSLLCFLLGASVSFGAVPVSNEYIVRLKPGEDPKALESLGAVEPLVEELGVYRIIPLGRESLESGLRSARRSPGVRYAQPNHRVTRRTLPNDPLFTQQWSLKHPGGRADIQAEAAWDVTTGGVDKKGNRIVVAVVDGGVSLTHADLKDNLWVNPGEIAGNGIDDDGNGYIDDIHGWNSYNNSGTIPGDTHGTHVAGIIGARGDNSAGITGINWDVGIMSVAGASSSTAQVLKAYGYVLAQKKLYLSSGGQRGANVVATNSSFGVDYGDCSSSEFRVWNDIYDEMGKVGILSVAATANLNINVDQVGDVPTGCTSPYIVAVTNTTEEDKRYGSAAFGSTHVDLGAPGTGILSTVPSGTAKLTGTSMATPHVAGAVALMHAAACDRFADLYQKTPDRGALLVKDFLLKSVDANADLAGKTLSGGRLNLYRAVQTIYNYGCSIP